MSLRRRFALIGLLALVPMAVTLALSVHLMLVESQIYVVCAMVSTAVVAFGISGLMARTTLRELEAIRGGVAEVGDGRREVEIPVVGDGELAALARDVEAMVVKLRVEENARQTLLAAVSHDLRTPITSLQLVTDAIEDDLLDAEQKRQYIARLGTHVRALSALIDDLFELSRLEAGEISWSLEQVQLDELVSETVDAMRPQADAGAVHVRAEIPADLVAARVNPERLQRVLFNLIQNAIRHTPADGSVVVRAEPVADAVEIEVADTGDGIAPEDRVRVFDPFVQGADRSARTDGSAGLGLAVARLIVEAHGGRIWLEDSERGTRVRFSVPAAPRAAVVA